MSNLPMISFEAKKIKNTPNIIIGKGFNFLDSGLLSEAGSIILSFTGH